MTMLGFIIVICCIDEATSLICQSHSSLDGQAAFVT